MLWFIERLCIFTIMDQISMSTMVRFKVIKAFCCNIGMCRDVVVAGNLEVYRKVDSEKRQVLMQAKRCELPYTTLRETADRYVDCFHGENICKRMPCLQHW